MANELNGTLEKESKPATKGDRKTKSEKKKQIKHLKEYADKLAEYDDKLGKLGDSNSYSKTDEDATFMRMKEDAMNNGQTKPVITFKSRQRTNLSPTSHCFLILLTH